VKTIIEMSKHWYFLQTDFEGIIIDANGHFRNSFQHIEPFRVHDLVHKDDLRSLRLYSEKSKRYRPEPFAFEIRTIQNDGTYNYGFYELFCIESGYVIIGTELFPSFEDGTGRMNRQYALLRQINFSLNHRVMKHVSNIQGLTPMLDGLDEKISRMLIESIEKVHEEVRVLVKSFNSIKKRGSSGHL
jgi:hypothetical protein